MVGKKRIFARGSTPIPPHFYQSGRGYFFKGKWEGERQNEQP